MKNCYHKSLPQNKSLWNRRELARHYQRMLFVTAHPESHAMYTFTRVSFPNKEPSMGKAIKINLISYLAISYGKACFALNANSPLSIKGLVVARERHADNDNLLDLGIYVTEIQAQQLRFSLPPELKRFESTIEKCDFIFPTEGSIMHVVFQPGKSGRRPPKYQGYVSGYYLNGKTNKTPQLDRLPIPPQYTNNPSL